MVSQGLVPVLEVLMTAECLVEPVKAAACSIHSASGLAEEDSVTHRLHTTHTCGIHIDVVVLHINIRLSTCMICFAVRS